MSDDLYIRAIPGGAGNYYYSYDVFWRGGQIVARSHDPECEACRILAARGVNGWVVVRDLETGKGRLRVNVPALARRSFQENDNEMRLAKYRPMPVHRIPKWVH